LPRFKFGSGPGSSRAEGGYHFSSHIVPQFSVFSFQFSVFSFQFSGVRLLRRT
jgi:hypothetical protein